MLFDTTFLIDLQREALRQAPGRAFRFLETHPDMPMRISVVTLGEMAEGFPGDRKADFLSLVQPYEVIPLSRETAWQYGQASRALRAGGDRIGDNDLWIACTALELGVPLVTRDRRHFDRIEGLRIITY